MADSNPLIQCARHCAYCLKSLPSGTAKLCGKCRRRAYCSKDCQVADWKQQRGSQGHKNWCGLACGEEDIDWEVKPAQGKGLGIIAKRLIPAKYRIMVEALRPLDHPGINDLAPIGGTLKEKIECNLLGYESHTIGVICLRISCINHDCAANSSHTSDPIRDVELLIANRDIQAGEEITISYTLFNDISLSCSPSAGREKLEKKWGVVCKDDCFCRDEEVGRLLEKSKIYEQMIPLGVMMGNTDRTMGMVRELLQNHDKIGSSQKSKWKTLYDGFGIGIAQRSTFEEGVEYLRRAYEIVSTTLHPNSKQVLDMKRFMDDPKSHPGYLFWEK